MGTVKDTIASGNESALELITGIQTRIVEAHKEFASAVAGLVPDVPSSLSSIDAPATPDVKELIEESFAFQAQLLEANRAFSLGLIEAWAQYAPESTTATTSKRAAKK